MRVFIGTDGDYHGEAEKVIKHSIEKNASASVEINFIRPGWKSGCTGFTTHRYLVPRLCNFEGYAIYLDVDMVVLGDIADLWAYRRPGKWCIPSYSGDEVSVIDCSAFRDLPADRVLLHGSAKLRCEEIIGDRYLPIISTLWNVEDDLLPGTNLLHFTNMATQPWHPTPAISYKPHRSTVACEVFFDYLKEAS